MSIKCQKGVDSYTLIHPYWQSCLYLSVFIKCQKGMDSYTLIHPYWQSHLYLLYEALQDQSTAVPITVQCYWSRFFPDFPDTLILTYNQQI